jgi:cyclophilin family peptidyl-prolyl cis-trans isomerase
MHRLFTVTKFMKKLLVYFQISSFRLVLLTALLLATSAGFAQKEKRKDYIVTLSTDFGTVKMVLFDQTPKHKENFLKLVKDGFYNGTLFHRTIEKFMIQGGDPNSKTAHAGMKLGNGDVGYKIPAEFVPELIHKKGVLAAAQDGNPQKASSGCQFYIVQGQVWDDAGYATQAARSGKKYTDEQRKVYQTIGGTPHLDGNYTVFGEVISGLDVVDSIAKQARDASNRPLKDIKMTMAAEKMRKRKIKRLFGYDVK